MLKSIVCSSIIRREDA